MTSRANWRTEAVLFDPRLADGLDSMTGRITLRETPRSASRFMNPSAPSQAAQAQAHQASQAGQRLLKRGEFEAALERFRVAHGLQPRDRLYRLQLARAYLRQDEPGLASELLEQVLRDTPGDERVLHSLVQCLEAAGFDERLVAVVAKQPEASLGRDLLVSLAKAQTRLRRHADAVSTWMRALAFDITEAGLHVRLAYSLYEIGLGREAAEALRTGLALGLGPAGPGCLDMLRQYERHVCDWQDAPGRMAQWRAGLAELDPQACFELSPFCHAVLLDDPELQLKGARTHARYLKGRAKPCSPRSPVARPRIRVGYLSSDFHSHATSYLMAQLLEQHDRSRFEVHAYSYGQDDGSACRGRITAAAERFIDLSSSSPAAMVDRIRQDEIDILVDLKGYTKDARALVMAARPAPLQVAYLGYPGTMGADFIDYIIGDPVVTPLELAHHFSEKLAQLPGCYQCNDGTRPLPAAPARASQGLPEHALVLCGFNNLYKVSPDVFDVWCGLLRRLPHAVLWLTETSAQAAQALRLEAQARGVDATRLVFAPKTDNGVHLDRIACADLYLDTWPCNGHTSASDALWAGLPVVTLSGQTFASRVAGSLLQAVGAPELVCRSVEQYEDLVLRLAGDEPLRAALRARLEAARTTSSLFDGRLRAREIEALYERMWARALQGQPPEHLLASAG